MVREEDYSLSVTVSGNKVPVNGYVKRVFASVILSLVTTLHGGENPETVEIKLDKLNK